ncbi:MAG TPA: pseudouridine synthase [Candidatus Paceibacterota bacterium]
MRINKYLAVKQIASRRKADELVKQKRVLINGRVAILGDDVKENDKITVKSDSRDIAPIYFAYNKPKGVLSHSAKGDEKDVAQMIKGKTEGARVFPLGRLDKDSHGLMILTNDGRITGKLLNPEENHEKEYIVETKEKLQENFAETIERGVVIREEYSKATYKTKPCLVNVLSPRKFSITLTEGKKRQVRRMVESMRNEVRDLVRIRIMNIALGKLPENTLRRIKGAELQEFLKELGMK